MKTISRIKTLTIGTLTVAFSTIPALSTSAVGGNSDNAMCTRAENLYTTSRSTVAAHVATMKSDFTTQMLRLTSTKADVEQKVLDARAAATTKFDEKITELKATANLTDAQMTAITKYETDMKAAMTIRLTAVDAARDTYRTALAETVQTQQKEMTNAVEAYQTALSTALTTAKEGCSGNANSLTELKSMTKTARTTLANAQKSAHMGDDIKALATTRNTAIKAANDAFKESAKAYTATLVAILQPSA